MAYNHNEVTRYKGKLIQEWRTDGTGMQVYYSNLGDVSGGGQTRILEGHLINEYYLLNLYHGTGKYFNSDGTVDIKGGPKDGMIRTPDDMKWLKSMIAAGYKFMPNQDAAINKIWYGDYIYADNNGDKIYGNSYDNRFTGFSGSQNLPFFLFGSQMNLGWKNFDLNLIWSGQAGAKVYWLERFNSSITRIGFQIGSMAAKDHYYYNESDPGDPANNIHAVYPRLKLNQNDTQNTVASTRWLYDISYLRLKNVTVGYTLPQTLINRLSIEKVRFWLSAENLLTITPYPGFDPEAGGSYYPLLRQFALGATITF